MDLKNSRLFQRLIGLFLVLTLLVCPYMFIGGMFAPKLLSPLEPVICPDGMEMETRTSQEYDDEGDLVTVSRTYCVDGQKSVDVSFKTILIMLGIPAFGVLVYAIAPTTGVMKEKRAMIDPEGMG